MSSQQRIQEFTEPSQPDETTTDDNPDWTQMTATANHYCRNCGAAVDPQLVRVLADNDGVMHACPNCCDSWTGLRYAASGREHPDYIPEGER